jgi:hypothetical protein
LTSIEENISEKGYRIYPNPFFNEFFIENLTGDEYFILYDFLGRNILEGKSFETLKISEAQTGVYYLIIQNNVNQTTFKLIKS